MIQRKQTLFLVVAVIAYVVCLFLPIASFEPAGMGNGVSMHCLGTVSGENGIRIDATCVPLFLLCALPALIALVTIFMYKNRKLQMNLCAIGLLFSVLWYIDYALILLGIVALESVEGKAVVNFGACLPLVAIILVALAHKGVSDDEKLVRAADRIR